MSKPTVAAATTTLYDRLPETYRDADARLDYPLLRYLSLLLDQLAPIGTLTERLDYDPATPGDTSDIVDGTVADAGWLPWLAQLLGVNLSGRTLAQQRAALANPSGEWAHGTRPALIAAAKKGTTGAQRVELTVPGSVGPWSIGVGTYDSETATLEQFGQLKASAPTWADLARLGSFAGATSPAVLVTAEEERPLGYKLLRYSRGA